MFRTHFNYDYKKYPGSVNTLPSETRQSDFEPLSKLVARVIRGEILPQLKPEDFELNGSENIDDVFNSPETWDTPGYDFSDAGSPYEDDIRQQMQQLNQGVGPNTPIKENNPQEQEQSGATSSSSDANVPVE